MISTLSTESTPLRHYPRLKGWEATLVLPHRSCTIQKDLTTLRESSEEPNHKTRIDEQSRTGSS